MGKIVVLDENTSNKIAAGEVIERPASVVKELVENSIDAGATNIVVEVKNGGISYIRVTDNGSGIDEDDAEIAFERHATSKIRSANDLESIGTLGFRGEALASIASVSTVELTTRVPHNTYGIYIKIQGGKVLEVRQTGCPVGTTFVISDLFYNTPARYKFLKKNSTEFGYISEILNRIALAKPHISIKLAGNNSAAVHTPGNNDITSTIFSIYGKEISRNIIPVNYSDSMVNINGVAGRPEISRSTRDAQSIFINGRYIKSKIVSAAIEEAYKTFVMKNKFPFVVLNIELNPMLVDVNVHPTKMEVRFSNDQEIFRSVYHAINNALLSVSLIRNVHLEEKGENIYKIKGNTEKKTDYIQRNIDEMAVGSKQVSQNELEKQQNKAHSGLINEVRNNAEEIGRKSLDKTLDKTCIGKQENLEEQSITKKHLEKHAESDIEKETEKDLKIYKEKELKKELERDIEKDIVQIDGSKDVEKESQGDAKYFKGKNNNINDVSYANNTDDANNIKDIDNSNNTDNLENVNNEERNEIENKNKDLFSTSNIIGQLFNTYILLQKENDFILIDQHAAHERVMFEYYREKFRRKENFSQILLSPVVIEFTFNEIRQIEEKKEIINNLGFVYEDFGNNSIIIREVPFVSEAGEVKELFLEVLDNIVKTRVQDYNLIADEVIYTISCKSAVKANKKLDTSEIKEVLRKLDLTENPYTCPHGRPVIVKLNKHELEKMFKRIL